MDELDGKVSLITGASRGIGRATALAFARRGSNVALIARNETKLIEVASELSQLGREAMVLPADVTDQIQVVNSVDKIKSHWGRIDFLIINAGEYIRSPIRYLTVDKIQQSMNVNFYSGIFCVLAVLPSMLVNKKGHIVFVTSMDAKKALPLDAPYVAAKFALTGFAEVLRQELHGSGIFVSNILPGRVDTSMIEDLKVPWLSSKIPPEEVAEAILNAINKRKVEIIIPPHASLLHYINVFWPRLADWIVRYTHLEGWVEPSSKRGD
jgi:short-subunit dehydrogenase